VLVKGILRSDDALLAVKHGVSWVIVSNHGARQSDTAPATISVLPEIVDTVGGKVEVYVDGGIRRSSRIVLGIHGSDFPGSEIGCFEPVNVFQDL
jgi:isopentenyl diphosphate isomerase/L-lactate dehydrogenase-like FMN-dependent dehydrogenase